VTLREPPFLFVVPACRPEHVARGAGRTVRGSFLDFSPRVSHVSKRLD